jgi:hypothetical protein
VPISVEMSGNLLLPETETVNPPLFQESRTNLPHPNGVAAVDCITPATVCDTDLGYARRHTEHKHGIGSEHHKVCVPPPETRVQLPPHDAAQCPLLMDIYAGTSSAVVLSPMSLQPAPRQCSQHSSIARLYLTTRLNTFGSFWETRCGYIDKHALFFFVQFMITVLVIFFCLIQLDRSTDCDSQQMYSGILTLMIGICIPQPSVGSVGGESDTHHPG